MTTSKRTILFVTGTRPEAIKIAPVILAMRKSNTLNPVLLHTGQHTDIALEAYKFFGIEPDYQIELKRQRTSLAHLTSILLEPISDYIAQIKPAVTVVHGDTTTTKVSALASFYNQVPVAHVEAGLRTREMYSPFPEEMNRSIVARLSSLHFAPTAKAEAELIQEGISSSIWVTGNTAVDAALAARSIIMGRPLSSLVPLDDEVLLHKKLILVTAHRRENWGPGIQNIAKSVTELARANPDLHFIWPLHPNPEVASVVKTEVAKFPEVCSQISLVDPLEYPALIAVLAKSHFTLTDSGGIQEEAAALNVPAFVLRESTERPELIEAGAGVLVGADATRITRVVQKHVEDHTLLAKMRSCKNPFGDGNAATLITSKIESYLL